LLGEVRAGFPSPAQDYTEDELDLGKLLVRNPPATYKMRVEGDALVGIGVFSGDILVIDRSLKPISGSIVVAVSEGEFLVRRFLVRGGKVFLTTDNGNLGKNPLSLSSEVLVWGVVTFSIHRCI
jgi:DNA polymerase V